MIIEMSRNGMIIGSHSFSHQDLTKIDIIEAKKEIQTSKYIIEQKIGIEVSNFSFPYGRENSELIRTALQSEYKYVYNSRHGLFNNLTTVRPRNSINSTFNSKKIKHTLFPDKVQEYKWLLEDFVKLQIKSYIGNNSYIKMRNVFIK